MLPGPIQIYQCPQCQNFIKQYSLMSGNTFGAKLYSDGKHVAPMLPEYPDLTKCESCNHIFWLSKQKQIGEFEYGDTVKNEWEFADDAEFLSIPDYYQALETGVAKNKEEEIDIRMRLWWSYNDRIRNSENIFNDENDELRWHDNVNKLLTILDLNDDNDKIVAAELYRNLGNFDACRDVVNSIENEDLEWVKEKFLKACNEKNRWVIQMN